MRQLAATQLTLIHRPTPQDVIVPSLALSRRMPARKIVVGTNETEGQSVETWQALGYQSATDMKKAITSRRKYRTNR